MLNAKPPRSSGDAAAGMPVAVPDSPALRKATPTATLQSQSGVAQAESKGSESVRLIMVAVQLAAALAIMYQFQLESRTFFNVMLLASAGFVVHALLPLQWRLPLFVALSMTSIVLALGMADGIAVLGLGLLMIGVCHVPLAMRWRIAMLAVSGVVFALWRVELLPAPWSVAIWPILASMFMFRIALYLHALKHDEKQPTPARTLAYFFMLPNVCFPLFPVVDYSTFKRTYYDRSPFQIYETGIKWIARGLVHLIAYRFVYVHLASDPAHLRTLGDLVQFLLATFLLYLRVSGQFHLIVGILYLFGFRLPETHHLYFLSSSFTDFWRRINIYWKDFMMKLVYYPSFFRLRRRGGNLALVGATIAVFLATWILHSYQWFWLRGGFPLEAQDVLFWGILGGLVVVGALREMKRSQPRRLARSTNWSFTRAIRTVGTFTMICVLWSLWSAESVMGWVLMWSAAGDVQARDLWILALLVGAGLVLGGRAWPVSEPQHPGSRFHDTALPAVTLAILFGLGTTQLYSQFAPQAAALVTTLQASSLNARDAALQHKGYYENLDNPTRQTAQLWDIRAKKPADWIPLSATPAVRTRQDFLGGELVPGVQVRFLGETLTTNQWGMRDSERAVAKPEGTYRIALLGPSHVMGSGVPDGATIADLLEQRLNASPRLAGVRYEVLNFGVAAHALTQQLALLQDRVLSFQPDAVFVVDSPRLYEPVVQHLAASVAHGYEIPFPALAAAVGKVGIAPLGNDGLPVPFDSLRGIARHLGMSTRMPWREAEHRLRRSIDELIGATLAEIDHRVRRHGAIPVFVALDIVGGPPTEPTPALEQAEQAGFLVFNLFDVWQGRDPRALRIADWDNHPNRDGNELVAQRLLELLVQHRTDLKLPSPAGPAS